MSSISSADILGACLIYLSSSLSSAAGIGGGILNVGIYLVVWGFSYQESAILSIATLFGNYGAQFFLVNVWLPHTKDPKRPLVYYDVALLMFPCQLGGANVGVILSYIFPETLLLILAMVVLLCSIGFAVDKTITIYEKENALLYCTEDSTTNQSEGETQSLLRREEDAHANVHNVEVPSEAIFTVPWDHIKIILLVWFIYATSYVCMNLVTECSWDYFVLLLIVYPIVAVQVILCRDFVIDSQRPSVDPNSETILPISRSTLDAIHIDEESANTTAVVEIKPNIDNYNDANMPEVETYSDGTGLGSRGKVVIKDDESHSSLSVDAAPISDTTAKPYSQSVLEGDILWDQMYFFPYLAAFCIGTISVLLGIGGGELMGPLLLTMNVAPDVVAATLPLMSFLTQSSSLVHYMTLGDVPYTYASIMWAIGLLGGLTGRSMAVWLYKVFKRASGLVMLLICVLTLSLGMYIYYLAQDWDDISFAFSSYC